mmetsp:Transcript_16868/g.38960  ORF Transcript_16868/g.38960 Transcript_16868/m.38960 type:complete len:96 (-) Transcript_16868:211-498(-)
MGSNDAREYNYCSTVKIFFVDGSIFLCSSRISLKVYSRKDKSKLKFSLSWRRKLTCVLILMYECALRHHSISVDRVVKQQFLCVRQKNKYLMQKI